MTKQEAFDKMVAHLASQKGRGIDPHGGCVYRSPSGLKCVVGALLSDEIVQEMLSNPFWSTGVGHLGVWRIFRRELALEDLADDEARMFYDAMQHAHDQGHDIDNLHQRLRTIAEKYKLDGEGIASITQWNL